MRKTKLWRFGLVLLCAFVLTVPVMAAEIGCDDVYCFASTDFSGDEALAGICITSVPEWGSLRLGARILLPGDIVIAEQLAGMTYHPLTTESDRQACITYLPIYTDRVEAAETMSIAVLGRTDQAPVAEDSALETYRNLPNEALLKVKDPENQPMTFTLVRTPRRGDVVIRDDGSFIYTPKKNKVGVDSFTYTATDAAGHVSREATVTVTILKPSDAARYSDTAGQACRFAAEWMRNTGIFVGENVNGNGCFRPEKEVSRGEFLTMLVGALEIPLDREAEYTGYTDSVPTWLRPYLAAAMRSGLTAGWPQGSEFGAEEPITGAEAAVMIQNALDLTVATVAVDEAVPAWAQQALSVLEDHGIRLDAAAVLTRADAALVMYRVSQLKSDAPGLMAIRSAQ